MTFNLIKINDLLATPPSNQWLIKNLIEKDSIGMIFGKSESGKSLLAMDIAFCVATGNEWNGNITTQGKVVYIAGEGQNGISKRFKALTEKYDAEINDIFISTDSASLTNEESANDVKDTISTICEDPTLIIIDTLARNFGDGDENSSRDMGKFITNIDEKLKHTGASILIIHHTGHDDKGRARGSSALRASLDVEYSLTRSDSSVTLKCTKAKEFTKPAPTSFNIVTHTITDTGWVDGSDQLESAVLKSTTHVETNILSGNHLIVFSALESEINENGIIVPDTIQEGLTDTKCIKLEDWRTRALTELDSPTDNSKRKAFNRGKTKALKLGRIAIKDEHVWLAA